MTPGLISYSATNGAVKMFVRDLPREVGTWRIAVNNIQPSPIDTHLNPPADEWALPRLENTAL
jgi:3-oxoacyl-[acyl-carrier protein] reductase